MRVPISQEEINKHLEEIEKLDFKRSFDLFPLHIVITDENANILYVNKAVETNTGFSVDESMGKNPADLWGGQMPKEFYEKLWRTIKIEKKPLVAEIRNKKKSGELYWQELRTAPILDEKGKVRFFIGMETDITKYKEETELRGQLLPVFYKLVNSIIASGDIVAALKEVVKIICQFTEWQVGELWMPSSDGSCLIHIYEWSKLSNEKLSRFIEITQKTMFAPGVGLPGRVWKNRAMEWIPDVKKESSAIFIRVQTAQEAGLSATAGFPIMSQGKVIAVIVFFMTAPREKDDNLVIFISDLTQKLGTFFDTENKDKFKEQFISILGHQVRNPLITIRWVLEELLANTNLGESERQDLEKAYRENQTLTDLIKDLLILSRVESYAMESETVQLDEELENILRSIQKKHPDVSFSFQNEVGPTPLTTVKSLALQIFSNIIYNSAEHADKQHGEVLIKLQKFSQGILFSCHNNGDPIPEDSQPHIFSKIKSTSGGEGLGLFIVKMICDYLTWKVTFKTGEDGTTFYVIIPWPNQ